MKNFRDELDNDQIKLRFELEQIIKSLKEYKYGTFVLLGVATYIRNIKNILGI